MDFLNLRNATPTPFARNWLNSLSALPTTKSTNTITIRRGELQKTKADILAYTISPDLDFSKGALSNAILKAAGSRMKSMLPQNPAGCTKVTTDGCNLSCQKVFHLCLPPFNGFNDANIEFFMDESLKEADSYNVSSIAFSTLGAGQLKYSNDLVTQNMLYTAHKYLSQSSTGLKEILIIIYPKDNNLFMSFKNEAQNLPKHPQIKINIEEKIPITAASISLPKTSHSFTLGAVKVDLIQGDILNENTDAIVHCTNASFSLNGAISKCLCRKIGSTFTFDCQSKTSEMQRNHFAVTNGHNLNCKLIFHLDIVSQLSEPEKILETCFSNAETYQISSISIPNLSTSGKRVPLNEMARAMVNVIPRLKSRYLKQVNVVLYEWKLITALRNDIASAQATGTSGTPVLGKISRSNLHQMKLLPSSDSKYQDVQQKFLSSLNRIPAIISIEMVINEPLKIQYEAQLQKIKALNPPKTQNERILWHGTKADIVASICKDGFDRGYCGTNGTWHGQGVYFAVNSEYSDKDTYTPRDTNGYKHMLMCRVATGEYTQGTPQLKVLPVKSYGTQKYDSAVNNVSNPTVFIIFNDVQAYPAYHITYR